MVHVGRWAALGLALAGIVRPASADLARELGLDLPRHGVADRVSVARGVPARTRVVYAELDGPGCIRHIFVTPTRWFEGNRETIIRIYFDGSKVPNVEAPVGDFFGVMHGREYYDLNTEFLSVLSFEGYNCYFPMPFAKSARIEFETGPVGNAIILQCDWTRYPGQEMKEPMRFCARWRREAPTESYGRDFLMLDADGPGRLVGFVYGVRLLDYTDRWSHGGSDNIYVDGEGDVPSYTRGVGGEDTFGAGYGGTMHVPETHLYTGMPYYAYEDTGNARPAPRVVGYRFFVQDPVEFQRSIHMRFGTMRNDICATVYWYQPGAPRPYVRLPSWDKLLTGTEGRTWVSHGQVPISVSREEVDLPLPDGGSWQMAGVFENAHGEAIRETLPAEGSAAGVAWIPYAAPHGFVDFNHVFRPHQFGAGAHYVDKVAVARSVVEAPRAMTANFRLAWDDHLVLRVNGGAPIDFGDQGAFRTQTRQIPLHRGKNDILVKLSNTDGSNHGGWVFNLRVTAPDGALLLPHAAAK